ncbi:ATP-binding protein [Lentzea albida]|uniref:Anti-sigma regulatory factor (Ser/Thr protein kinase) n=1 Tax=Lentzea albida TaxID=65499 RepID=A0A1H9WEJ4_9PSEU|nr:ATP-binding protein [Lentzea albida]SES32348.1 Anti-sigma regulatory factor (Ser/Thr protein kinase) [Lentzea albida]
MTGISVRTADLAGMVVATPVGRLDVTSYPVLRDGLLKLAAEAPVALLVRLGADFETAGAAMLSVFTTVCTKVSDWPDVPVVLIAETERHRHDLGRSGITRSVATAPDLISAVELAQEQPLRRLRKLSLPGTAAAPSIAREAVRDVCEEWDLPHLLQDALVVVTELVGNAVRHARTDSVLRVELRRTGLTLAVTDGSPEPPVLGASRQDLPGHRGLELVDGISRAWGSMPAFDGSKVVWAVLALGPKR